ncbi:porin family protein [Lysobacter pythonis]|uniref:Porin family protein n=1 Tax=Solilutibacter pythonis TaxID=2483112 RepID=A0A3M2I1M7_9GAMM|nr:outer membrane beta-barrel protein [Lysobacter pythonis]RMH93870.1 porin family protein [Lysobacter pythonis]
MFKNKKITTALAFTALAAAFASSGAFAQSATGQPFVRGEIGRTTLSNRDGAGSLKDNAFVLRGGYMFNQNFGLEGFYGRYYGKTNKVAGFDNDSNVDGYGIGAIGKVRFGDTAADTGWYGMGRAGIMRSSYEAKSTGTVNGVDISYSRTTNSNQPYVGVGVGYDFTPNMGVSVNYDYFRGNVRIPSSPINDKLRYNAKTLSAGFEYRF